jgi:hypothetical protein
VLGSADKVVYGEGSELHGLSRGLEAGWRKSREITARELPRRSIPSLADITVITPVELVLTLWRALTFPKHRDGSTDKKAGWRFMHDGRPRFRLGLFWPAGGKGQWIG